MFQNNQINNIGNHGNSIGNHGNTSAVGNHGNNKLHLENMNNQITQQEKSNEVSPHSTNNDNHLIIKSEKFWNYKVFIDPQNIFTNNFCLRAEHKI